MDIGLDDARVQDARDGKATPEDQHFTGAGVELGFDVVGVPPSFLQNCEDRRTVADIFFRFRQFS